MNIRRRSLVLQASAAAAIAGVHGTAGAQADPGMDPVPPLPGTPTPGKPGDFDFLIGEWRIDHFRRKAGGAAGWDRFTGEATCWTILGGICSVEELRIPERGFSGMGLRLLDVEKRRWSDHWVNAKSGVVGVPGQPGSFENGVGIFHANYEENGRPMRSLGVWDRITSDACRWRQVFTADGGNTWTYDWVMHWRKV